MIKRNFLKVFIFAIVGCLGLLSLLTSCGSPVMPGPDVDTGDVVISDNDDNDISSNKMNLSALNPSYSSTSKTEATTTEDVFVDVVDFGTSVTVMVEVDENSLGSGVIYGKENGIYYVLTNDHVVSGGTNFSIKTNQEENLVGTLIGTSSTYDIAVLTFSSEKEYEIVCFEEGEIKAGQYCFAIGTPIDVTFFNTSTIGNVSLLLEGQVMHTASINSGNSGGPLLNSKGNLIGLNNSKISGETNTGASIENMFFAISIDNILNAIKEINTPKLGISTLDVSTILEIANYESYNEAYYVCGISYEEYKNFRTYAKYIPSNVKNGLFVASVETGSNAYSYIYASDVLMEIDNFTIQNVYTIKFVLSNKNAGDDVKFKLYRSNELIEVTIKLK